MKNKIVRFYNMEVSSYGQPFIVCKKCLKDQQIPEQCTLDEMGETKRHCENCGKKP